MTLIVLLTKCATKSYAFQESVVQDIWVQTSFSCWPKQQIQERKLWSVALLDIFLL